MDNKSRIIDTRSNLFGSRLTLRPITLQDVTEEYVSWMNNPESNQFLESRFTLHSQQSIEHYLEGVLCDPKQCMYAIIITDSGKHIGNIKLGPILWEHLRGDIGLLIGSTTDHGKGYATESLMILKQYAFETLGLHKLTAGIYENNIGSMKAFTKAGFHIEATLRQHCKFQDSYVDCHLMATFNEAKS